MQDRSLLALQDLLGAVNGTLFNEKTRDASFLSVCIDSRRALSGSLFIAVPGSQSDGHAFIKDAVDKGASLIMAMRSSVGEFGTLYEKLADRGIPVVLTDNTLNALQKAAGLYVSRFSALKKIGVTGSSGKTTVKECIGSILSQKYRVIINEGNLNSETGLPLSVFKIDKTHEAAVFEMGMNRRGEIKELADVLFPQTAVITNIGSAHIGILGTKDKIAEEKKQIFSNFTEDCTGFVPAEDPYKDFLMSGVPGRMHSFGIGKEYGIEDVRDRGVKGSEFYYKGVKIDFPLCGIHNLKNAACALAVAEHFGLNAEEIKTGLEAVRPLAGRMQILEGAPTVVHDCYNANPDSMNAAVDFFDEAAHEGRKVLILGDMGELGAESASSHKKLVQRAAVSKADILVFAGHSFCAAYDAVCRELSGPFAEGKRVLFLPDISDAALTSFGEKLASVLHEGDLILIKASRSTALERFIPIIQKKSIQNPMEDDG
ncbi:UDP-N-acetylmuramoyl-tripeptide--D-alanyl-D-alanine ligase [Treponema sp. HNW]|uniref:UDP-N-acetylmuramoyl-tripeptide--D-alanyl-D- alanine ligase n=1 Tax=Treponema sp. HNW TaxID=3116654 RepID=UPI003D139319